MSKRLALSVLRARACGWLRVGDDPAAYYRWRRARRSLGLPTRKPYTTTVEDRERRRVYMREYRARMG